MADPPILAQTPSVWEGRWESVVGSVYIHVSGSGKW